MARGWPDVFEAHNIKSIQNHRLRGDCVNVK